MTYTMTILDVSGIQQYLFSSNRLTHNLGASYLVNQAITQWIKDSLEGWQSGEIESGVADYEIWYSGGGNAVLFFDGRERAIEFAKRYTRRLLTDAPGLRVVINHTDFKWDQPLADIYTRALQQLAQKKAEQIPIMPSLGLGVTAACQYTGLPAVGKDDEGKLVSAEIKAKLNAQADARRKLTEIFQAWLEDFEFAYDFNLFGERGKASYIAVVHADGNGMGKRKLAICLAEENRQDNRKFIQTMRKFSIEVEEAGCKALREAFNKMMNWILKSRDRHDRFVTRDERNKKHRVKFVPLVFGGDDVTFVCDGRLGLSLAAIFLQEFNKIVLEVDQKPLYTCAGVAIVKNRYPFARAYEMAEALCQNAKNAVRKWKEKTDSDALALDWHFAVGGAVLPISEIRQREYSVEAGKLFARPYLLNNSQTEINNWENFRKLVFAFQSSPDWVVRRNKIKALREQLRQGPDATENYLKVFDLPTLPPVGDLSGCQKTGWYGTTCVYFDAIEAMDLFEDLEEEIN